ncbi:phytoene desaturase [Mucilaginibacter hurinus]|uniref:Phytoene desaturase n=1 Tax=Mucilaginibacter hurinus TaxID=2201324 RepID=A0A367GR13_9SPHI|nr:1-hydroxycarotenoid 3,4-desaturase CrtD [Mucilaginibacter hurinus]RCH55515.1 phytoene desaturase [Mucilaginibacter hurinus]
MPPNKVIIIGAGIAGIAAAIRLTVKGYQAEVFEANAYPGGKLTEFDQQGYRFDAGPSLFTMPQYVDELFLLAGKDPREYFNYQKLNRVCNYFYEDGTQLTAYADVNNLALEIAGNTDTAIEDVLAHAAKSQKIYAITNHVFLERSLHRLKTYLRWDTLRSIWKLRGIDAGRTMHKANKSFFKDDRVVQLFNRYATYNGSNPYKAPATLNVIPHLEQHYGTYFPQGGMYSITASLVKLAEDLGVKFTYNAAVSDIVVEGGKTAGITLDGAFVPANIVVSNTDIWFTYKKLLKKYPALHPKKILNQQRSSSALIFYWGISKQFEKLDLHNIFFSADYEAEFKHIWEQKNIYHDPTIYLNVTAKYNPEDAPDGHENWFVMINVPANEGQDWDTLIAAARKNVIDKLTRLLGQDIAGLIQCESILDPRSIESRTSSYQGSLYGTSSNNKFAAFLRHANRSGKVNNLYCCGGSVHPGGGIPLCLLSAKIVSDWVPDV